MAGRKAASACARFVEKCAFNGTGCIEWIGGTTSKGYGLFSVGGKRGRMVLAHRWLYEQATGMVPAHLDVCHKCDNPRCVNIDHLFAGTRKENMQDAVRKGRTSHAPRASGEKHGRALLTEAGIREIRKLRADGFTLAFIAKEFSTSIANVHRIVHNRLWKGISCE